MFAFALWDKTKKRLVLARDRMGIKPLFYSAKGDGSIVFGSEIKALLASKKSTTPSICKHTMTIWSNYVPGPKTMISSIKKLTPGQCLVWTPDNLKFHTYWVHPLRTNRFWLSHLPFDGRPKTFIPCFQSRRTAYDFRCSAWHVLEWRHRFNRGPYGNDAPVNSLYKPSRSVSMKPPMMSRLTHRSRLRRLTPYLVEVVRPDVDTFEPLIEILDEPFADGNVIPLWYLSKNTSPWP